MPKACHIQGLFSLVRSEKYSDVQACYTENVSWSACRSMTGHSLQHKNIEAYYDKGQNARDLTRDDWRYPLLSTT